MSAVPKENYPQSSDSHSNMRTIGERIEGRRSDEIVIAFCGPVGCNLADVIRTIRAQFEEYGYLTEHIKISDIIKDYYRENGLPSRLSKLSLSPSLGKERYTTLQDLGNDLRQRFDSKILAALAMAKVAANRDIAMRKNDVEKPPKTVYIVDQLKHPEEAELFKLVYGNIFYLIGVLSPQNVRFNYLTRTERIPGHDAQFLIDRDRDELRTSYGQKLEKTVQLADYFIRNNQDSISNLLHPCQRFVALVHGKNGVTPTKDESGMYAAYSASLKSACLSRQVGAAIANKEGNVISLGWNDVPKFGGGLYTSDSTNDQRCIYHGGKCYNDIHKSALIQDIVKIVSQKITVTDDVKDELAKLIQKETRAGSIIEFSRAIHAEMEAILGLARSQGNSTDSCVLYTTTFPCHNCARHIIAAGIKRVVYIEPYEKSLALDLHEDAITTDENHIGKTLFETFSGVAPSKYASFFIARGNRKDSSGTAIDIIKTDATHIGTEYLDPYQTIEGKVVQDLMSKVSPPTLTPPPIPPIDIPPPPPPPTPPRAA
ncbi:deoxycytidylate deaminase [Pseudomonas sp. MYb2]|uniref:anti-phage dCTP deaminase n=1 Tax=unclassified Pseudomonas TaxID=196821 RepID=UPI000CFECAC3|nr:MULTISPECIES: anti-phage dCTP deaminase [unclassified Pseudomonas]PRB54344.1 deoxycytidylate deaminase [Pseudomonas sp. MYb3]PRC37375.1 deoxycytidylate deaminase [Pseudomonas sp. MYb2]